METPERNRLESNKQREAIRAVFAEWEKLPRMPSDWKIVSVQDVQHERYALQHVSFAKDRYDTRLLAYLEIRDGKIWLLTDNTEEGIATELVTAGISKDAIVLGFYPPAIREIGDFAVA